MRRASVQCAQPPVGGEWGGRGAPPAGLEGVLRAEPRRRGPGTREGVRARGLLSPPPAQAWWKPWAAWASDGQLPGS